VTKISQKSKTAIESRVGLRIRELRKKVKLSQEALALKADIDRTYINSVENGKRNISIKNIEKIANALGVSLKEFFSAQTFKEYDREFEE